MRAPPRYRSSFCLSHPFILYSIKHSDPSVCVALTCLTGPQRGKKSIIESFCPTSSCVLLQEGSLRQKHGAPSSPSKGIAKAFRQARSRFETLSEGGALSRPGSAAPSAAASPQQPPRTPVAARHQAQPSHEAYSPLVIGPPAAHNIQWTLHQSPARWAAT